MTRPSFERLAVLCLDDNSFMHELLRAMFAALRIKDVRFALAPDEALAKMHQRRPDLVIVDLELGGNQGTDFIRTLRRAEDSPDPYVAIIALSAYTDREHVIAARDAGATEILAKPLSGRALYDRLVYMSKHNRPFIKAAGYVGPDRRRQVRPFDGADRRSESELDVASDAAERSKP